MDKVIRFGRLTEVERKCVIELMNDPAVRRHLPLARGPFNADDCARFVRSKERMWQERGYGPWAFIRGVEFIGWGGLQPEGADADVGLVLRRSSWGVGKHLFNRIISFAFHDLALESVIALLPETRVRGGGLQRLGFVPDGVAELSGERFVRFRLWRPDSPDLRT